MSGSTIGGVVGAVVGFYFGNPQLGWMIGSAIGGAVDPEVIEGPRIGDGAKQSSAEGAPIAWIVGGCSPWIQGNICAVTNRREVKKEDDGKGGPVQITYEAHQDYCLLVCESSEIRESTVVGPLIVKVNGKIVYDMRPEKNFGADNAKFQQNHTFYLGNEDHGADPTLEAFFGIGETPFHRGDFTCVARDINLSQYGDAIPVYEWVMVASGEVVTTETEYFAAPIYGRFQNASFPLVDPDSMYTLTGRRDTGTGGIVSFSAATRAEIIEHFSALGYDGNAANVGTYLGYSASTSTEPHSLKTSMVTTQLDVTNNTSVLLVYSQETPVEYYDLDVTDAGDVCPLLPYVAPGLPEWYGFDGGQLARIATGVSPPSEYAAFNNCTGLPPDGGFFPYIQGIQPLYIRAEAKSIPPSAAPIGDPCLLGVPVALPDQPGFVIDCDGNVGPQPEYEAVSDFFNVLQAEDFTVIDGRFVFLEKTVGPVLDSGDPANTEAFWEAAYDAAVIAGTMPPGKTYPADYPEGLTAAYRATITTSSVTTNASTVASAIQKICARGGLDSSRVNVADIDQTLLGYAILDAYDGADSLRPLLTAFASFASEYDGKLNFHKHGADVELVIDPDEMIEGEDQSDESERDQAKEYPRSLLLSAVDITQDFAVRQQVARRVTPDVRAIGEETMQVSVVMEPDQHKQTAEIYLKRAWARLEGKRKFSLPFAGASEVYLKLVPGVPFGLEGKRYIVGQMLTEDCEIAIEEAPRDRQSAYVSVATAIPALPPTPAPSSIGGSTLFAAMNLPRLRSKDNSPGMYIAVAGLLASWPGCVLQMSIDDGATWTTAFNSMTQASVIGYLTADLDDTPSDTLSVSVHGGQLNSITDAQIADGGNPIAIVTAAVAEVMQFKDADETTPDRYDLTELTRGGLGTTAVAHNQGDRFVHLGNIYFLPLDISLSGRTIKFRPVTFGTIPENNATYDVVFSPLFTGPEVSRPLTVSGVNVTVGGNPIYVVT